MCGVGPQVPPLIHGTLQSARKSPMSPSLTSIGYTDELTYLTLRSIPIERITETRIRCNLKYRIKRQILRKLFHLHSLHRWHMKESRSLEGWCQWLYPSVVSKDLPVWQANPVHPVWQVQTFGAEFEENVWRCTVISQTLPVQVPLFKHAGLHTANRWMTWSKLFCTIDCTYEHYMSDQYMLIDMCNLMVPSDETQKSNWYQKMHRYLHNFLHWDKAMDR